MALKKKPPPILLIAPETGRLPEDMGTLARYISGKGVGLGEVVAALCSPSLRQEIKKNTTTARRWLSSTPRRRACIRKPVPI